MITQPLIAGFLGGWEILLVLGIVTLLGLAVVVSLLVITISLTRISRAAKPESQTSIPANQPPSRRS